MEYVTHWRNTMTNVEGTGLPQKREIAKAWADYMNGEYPYIVHTAKPANQVSKPDGNSPRSSDGADSRRRL